MFSDPMAATVEQAILGKVRLRTAKRVVNMDSGVCESWFVPAGAAGIRGQAFVKRDREEFAKREVAAYHVARISGLVDVAPCIVKPDTKWAAGTPHVNMALVVAMRWTGYEQLRDKEPTDAYSRRVRLFDYIIRNWDRHHGNSMLRGRHVVAVDHGFAFDDAVHRAPGVHFDDYECIRRLRRAGWQLLWLLNGLLDRSALNGFIQRLGALDVPEE
jgi:hypothetical protein